MKKILCLLTFLCAFSAINANAGIMLEPYLGYNSGTLAHDVKTSGASEGGKVTGMGAGLRLGYKLPLMLWLAADYGMMSGGKFSADTAGLDGKVDSSDIYVTVGFDLPILARVWAGYGLGNTAKVKFDSGPESKLTYESAMKIGVGFKLIPMLSLNAEYFMKTLKDFEDNTGATVVASNYYSTANASGFMVSISAPFDF